ncbi:disease resistance protein RBA1-like [Brassica napus]|uniref:disease resistance protein RBA1-like n=1 Tax=Brassica napus TaxID=3708 RepID=UPI002078EE7B|nr:disease resistance protein RBA1-like [Brassica napus]
MDVHRQVFFNYRGEELRYNFISHLIKAFEKHEINFFVDKYEQRGKDLKNLFVRIDESRIALAIFSTRYAESSWCMDELVKMKKLADQRKLQIIPIFYKVSATDVRKQTVEIRSGNGRKPWSVYPTRCSEADFVKEIVKEVKRVITATGLEEEEDIHLEEKGESLRTADKYKRGYFRQKKRNLNEERGDLEERAGEIQNEEIDDVAGKGEDRETGNELESLQLEFKDAEMTVKYE